MRWLICACTALTLAAVPAASQKDAAMVLAEMRAALGGDAALETVRTFSISGSRSFKTPFGDRRLSLEWYALLPDHFLEIRRDTPSGPIAVDIVYYNGVRGDEVIRRTDARGVNFPPEPRFADNSPQAVEARRRAAVARQKQELAKIVLVLLGKSLPTYPLQLAYAGQEQAAGQTYDVVDAAGPDGFASRLHVDAATHRPAMLSWQDERPVVVTTSSIVGVNSRSGEVVSRSPESAPVVQMPAKPVMIERRWIFSDFKTQDGITWPRRIEEIGEPAGDIRLGRIKINPNIDTRKFNIK